MQRWLIIIIALAIPVILPLVWIAQANARLELEKTSTAEEVAVARAAEAGYCSPELKRILRRVLRSCGLIGQDGSRGCQPLAAKNVATVSGDDFNALFNPMRERGGIVQFEVEKSDLDVEDIGLVDQVFADQKGASYFLVVARASPDGDLLYNRELSKSRAEAVLHHLETQFKDPDLKDEVGLLWLGEEYAQLDKEFCSWRRSANESTCQPRDVNRGAFVAWIDCEL